MEWHDPFGEDEAGRAREARRAERDARRRARRESLADKVRADSEPAAEAPAPQPARQAPIASSPEPAGPASSEAPPGEPDPTALRTRLGELAARRHRGPARPGRNELLIRRLIGAGLVVAAIVLVVVGVGAVLDRLGGEEEPAAAPAKPLKVEEVVIPEGLDRRQIAGVAKKAGLRGDYVQATESAKGFDPGKYGAANPPSLEGFLFPATYELERDAKVGDLVARQLEAFEENLRGVDLSYAKSKNLTAYDVLIIASMIEREIQVPEERRLAAAVIYNRLSQGDTLGIDATIRYHLENYDEQLTESELAEPHPYNTRVNPGLPPTPIGNPGLASIEAAAKPARSDAYFFVVKPGTCGEHVFVETEEEFAAAEADYQAALEAEGGSPTEC